MKIRCKKYHYLIFINFSNCLKTIFNNLHVYAKLDKADQEQNKNKTQQILILNKHLNNNDSSNNYLTKSFSSDHVFEDYYYMNKNDKESVSNGTLIKLVLYKFLLIYNKKNLINFYILIKSFIYKKKLYFNCLLYHFFYYENY